MESNKVAVIALIKIIKRGDFNSLVSMKDVEPAKFLNAIESFGDDLMKLAISLEHFQIAEHLLDNNCFCEIPRGYGALARVAGHPNGSSFIQKLLKRHGVDVNGTYSYVFSRKPLVRVCVGGASRDFQICDAMDRFEEFPLHHAVACYNIESVRLLLDAGADVNLKCQRYRDREGYEDFWAFEYQGHTALNLILFNVLGTVPRCKPLEVLRALCSSWPFSVEEVLSNLQSLETPDENNVSPDWDLVARQLEIISLLLKYDKSVCQSEKKVVVRYLRILEEFSVDSNLNEQIRRNYYVMQSFRLYCSALAQVLMKHSEDPDKVSSELSSLLMNELKGRHPFFKLVDLLLQLGADVNFTDHSYNQYTPLHLAVLHHHGNDRNEKLLRILAKRAKTIDPRDKGGYTPFMKSVRQNTCTFELAKLFVELNADTTLVNNAGQSIWGLALQIRGSEVLDHLVCCGLNWDMKEECSSFNILKIINNGYSMDSETLLIVRRLLYSDAIYKKRQALVESFVGKHFPNCSSNLFNYLTCCCAESLSNSSIVREMCTSFCTLGGAAIFLVEAENYILRTNAFSLDEDSLWQLLEYRLQWPRGSYFDALQKEIELMKSQIVFGSLTLHQLIQGDEDQSLAILENVEALDSIWSFETASYPIMNYVIKERCRNIISRRNLLAAASPYINSIFSSTMLPFSSFFTLPDHIIKQISSHLSKSDLCHLILVHSGMTEDLWRHLEALWRDHINNFVDETKSIRHDCS